MPKTQYQIPDDFGTIEAMDLKALKSRIERLSNQRAVAAAIGMDPTALNKALQGNRAFKHLEYQRLEKHLNALEAAQRQDHQNDDSPAMPGTATGDLSPGDLEQMEQLIATVADYLDAQGIELKNSDFARLVIVVYQIVKDDSDTNLKAVIPPLLRLVR